VLKQHEEEDADQPHLEGEVLGEHEVERRAAVDHHEREVVQHQPAARREVDQELGRVLLVEVEVVEVVVLALCGW